MIEKNPILTWKQKLLQKIYNFSAIAGLVTLLISSYVLIESQQYLIVGIYFGTYLMFLAFLFSKNVSYNTKVNVIILVTFIIATSLLLLNNNLGAGLLWLFMGLFLSGLFYDKKRVEYYFIIATVLLATHIINIYYNFIPLQFSDISEEYLMIRNINGFIFLVATIVYINKEMTEIIVEAFNKEKRIGEELRLENEEKEKYKQELQKLNETLNEKVEEQTKRLKDAMKHLKSEIKEHQKTEKELKKAKGNLLNIIHQEKTLNELKSKFISMISHEYRTPLTVIMNSTYLLDKYFEMNDKEKFDNSIDKINESITSMTNLLEEVIKFGRSQKDMHTINIIEFDVVNKIKDVVMQVESDSRHSHNITILPTDTVKIKTDPNHIHYILHNLLKNAIEYSEKDTQILVKIIDSDDEIKIHIEDDGVGIPDKDKEKIFEPFYRGENTVGKSGTGLGLTISQRYAAAISAEIDFESDAGKGSIFKIILPKEIDEFELSQTMEE